MINGEIIELKKSGKIYNLHSYWTKQPTEVIERFLAEFTNEGDKVLDCFAGTGMTGVASKKMGRVSFLYDISKICNEISRGYTTKIEDYKAVDEEFSSFKLKMEKEFADLINITVKGETKRVRYSLYSRDTKCPNCLKLFNTFNEEVKCLREKIKCNEKKCPYCGFQDDKKFILEELKLREITVENSPEIIRVLDIENYKNIVEGFKDNKNPDVSFFGKEPERNYKFGITKVYQIYSKPNRIILNGIKSYINRIKDPKIKTLFRFVFSSILFNCSLLSAYTKYENTTYRTGTYYIPRIVKDNNPLDSFSSKFKLIVNTLKDLYPKDVPVFIYNGSATDLKSLDKETIDYVYIDPPYSDIIPYSELNLVWEAWLDLSSDYKNEIIVNKGTKKDLEYYQKMMALSFLEINRVLKKGKALTLIFHHPKPSHWGIIQKSILNSGFKLITEDPIRLRSNSKTHSQITTSKAVQGFLALNFVKSDEKTLLKELNDKDYFNLINDLKNEAINKLYTSKEDIYDYIITKVFSRYVIKDFKI